MAAFDNEELTNFGLARVFKYEELKKATNSFTTELGVGGYGSVYLGTLTDGQKVAVKLLHDNNPKRLQQFLNEIMVLPRLRHKNLVTLQGCTNPRGNELLLVYDYVPNSTVDDHLHGKRSDLTLAMRVQIAMETAEVLVYLHALDPPLIHRDVKTSNIMLDDGFHVKLCDLGLCRLLPWDSTQVLTEAQGTLGYRDPEYDRTCILTVKSDVYSFGMMLVELISAQMVVDVHRPPGNIYLADFALNKIVNKKLDDIVDQKLGYNNNIHHKRVINSLAKLAVKCLRPTGIVRPTMEQVLTELKNIDNELQEKQVFNASLINGTSRITCLIRRFRAAVIVPLMIILGLIRRFRAAVMVPLMILCCLWYGMSYCKAKEEGGENSGTSLIACLIRRTCITVSVMIVFCCLWHFRRHCTIMIRSLVEIYIALVIFLFTVIKACFEIYNALVIFPFTVIKACLYEIYIALVIFPFTVIKACLYNALSIFLFTVIKARLYNALDIFIFPFTVIKARLYNALDIFPFTVIKACFETEEEGDGHSGTAMIEYLLTIYSAVIIVPSVLIDVGHIKAKEEGGEHSGTIVYFLTIYSVVVVVPVVLIQCHFKAKEEGGEHSGTSWNTRLKKTYLPILYLLVAMAVALCLVPLVLILCCSWYYTSLTLVPWILILCCLWLPLVPLLLILWFYNSN